MLLFCYDYKTVEANEHKKNKLFLCTNTLQWPETMKHTENVVLNEPISKYNDLQRKNINKMPVFFMEANIHFWCC